MNNGRFLKNIGFYFIGSFATKIIQFLFIPLYSKYIRTDDFGYFSLLISIISITLPILFHSIWEGVLRFSIQEEGNEKIVLTSTTTYSVFLIFIYTLLFFVISHFYFFEYSWLILFMGVSQFGSMYWQYSARALKENKFYTYSTVFSSLITIFANLFFILVLKWGFLSLILSFILGQLSLILVLEFKIKLFSRYFSLSSFDRKILYEVIKYSFPLGINAISWWILTSSNNIVLTYFFGNNVNGIYSMAVRFGSLLSIFTLVINMAWLEESFRIHNNNNKDEYFNIVLDNITRIVFSAVLILIPSTYIIYKYFVFGDYKNGIVLTSILYLGSAYATIATHLGSVFLARKESNILFKTTFQSGLFSILSSIVVAYFFNFFWVVLFSSIGFGIMFYIRIPLIKKNMELNINYLLTIGLTLLIIFISILCFYVKFNLYAQTTILLSSILISIFINKKLLLYIISKFINKKL